MKYKINELSTRTNWIIVILLAIYSIICILPVVVVISTSFTSESYINLHGYSILPKDFSLEAYEFVFNGDVPVWRAYVVTIISTVLGGILSLLAITMFAYPLYRADFKYRNVFSFILFITMIFNGGLVPWYLVCARLLNLRDTIWALIVPYAFNAFYVIVMRTFYKTNISESLVESAKIDGANEFTIFFKIIIPLSKPGIATIGLFCTIGYWNDWYLPLMLISDPKYYNLQYLIYKILTNINVLRELISKMGQSLDVETPTQAARMAMCVITMGPIILAYPFFQKYFIKGLTIGAIKG